MDLLKDLIDFAEEEATKYRKWLYEELDKEFGVTDRIREILKSDSSNKINLIEEILK